VKIPEVRFGAVIETARISSSSLIPGASPKRPNIPVPRLPSEPDADHQLQGKETIKEHESGDRPDPTRRSVSAGIR